MATLTQLRPCRSNGPIRRIISRPADVRRVFPIPKKWDSLPREIEQVLPDIVAVVAGPPHRKLQRIDSSAYEVYSGA